MPEHVRSFVGLATDMSENFVNGCWRAFGDVIWCFDSEDSKASKRDAKKFREYSLDHLLASRMLFPPVKTCTSPGSTVAKQGWCQEDCPVHIERWGMRNVCRTAPL